MIQGIYFGDEDETEKELRRRQENRQLREEVENFLGEIPECFNSAAGLTAVLSRPIATPHAETLRFFERSRGFGLRPVLLEYTSDMFHSANIDKRSLVRLEFYHGKGKRGGDKITVVKIADIHRHCRMAEIQTRWGEPLVSFHHRMLALALPDVEVFDLSAWLHKNGGRANRYYERYLGLFIWHAALFENFLLSGEEKNFTLGVVKPAVEALYKRFGCMPLITPLLPLEEENEELSRWNRYPPELLASIPSFT